MLDRQIDKQKLSLGPQLDKKRGRDRRGLAQARQYSKTLATRQIAVDQRRRGSLAGLARRHRRRADRGLHRVRPGHQARRISRRRPARHGRLQPRPGSAGGDVRPANAAGRACAFSIPPFRRRSRRSKPISISARPCSSYRASRAARPSPMFSKIISSSAWPMQSAPGKAGRHFIAVTDPGSSLQQAAQQQDFRQVFYGVPSIGGRYSVLSPFGLVPAAIAGIDVARLVAIDARDDAFLRAGRAAGGESGRRRSASRSAPPHRAGRDKITILASPALSSFGAWAEQLFAEFDRQARQGSHPHRRRAARPAGRLRRRPLLHRPGARRRDRRRTRDKTRTRWKRPDIRSSASRRIRSIISARNSSASRSQPRSPARCSGSIHSISPTSKPARSKRAN